MIHFCRKTLALLLFVSLFLAVVTTASARRSYVVPTPYGYGAIERYTGVIRPYMAPSQYPHYPQVYPSNPAWNVHYPSYAYPYQLGYPAYGGAYTGSYGATYTGTGQFAGWVNQSRLNLRSSPKKTNNVIGTLFHGERVWVQGRSGNWYFVRSSQRPGISGYAHVNCISSLNAGAGNYGGYGASGAYGAYGAYGYPAYGPYPYAY
jgi:uncharacterized protein YgiM (DUF1202 family)